MHRGKSTEMPILFEDRDIVIVDKPSGLLSVSTDKENEMTAYRMVSDYVKEHDRRARIFVLHRIDRDTSGILAFAKNREFQYYMQDNWNDLITLRGYVALVEGKMERSEGEIRSYLSENKANVVYVSDSGKGKLAITHYKVIKSSETYSLLELEILTGRKNQIRVQLADSGHPIAGDKKYGAKTNPISRLALHADCFHFIHPATGKEIKIQSTRKIGFEV